MIKALDIAICGCGPAGLGAACFLADAGHRVVLFERFGTPKPIGAGLLLQPAGLAALDRIGAAQRVRALGQPITGFTGATAPRGRTIFNLSYARLDPALHGLGIHRAALFSVLWSAVQARRIPVETGTEIDGVEAAGDSRLQALAGARRTGAFDLVVDASGAGSRLRRGVDPTPAQPYGYGAVWATVENRGFAPEILTQRYVRARHMIGILPVGTLPGETRPLATLFWSLKPADHDAFVRRGLAAWQADVIRLWPESEVLVSQITGLDRLTLARYGQYTMAKPFAGRLVFIGDAAHSTSPQLGAGVTMALLDAAALCDSLRTAATIDAAFQRYAAARRRHVRFYQRMSRLLTPAFQSDTRTLAWLRDVAMPLAGRWGWVDRRMMEMFAGLALGPFAAARPDSLAFSVAATPPAPRHRAQASP